MCQYGACFLLQKNCLYPYCQRNGFLFSLWICPLPFHRHDFVFSNQTRNVFSTVKIFEKFIFVSWNQKEAMQNCWFWHYVCNYFWQIVVCGLSTQPFIYNIIESCDGYLFIKYRAILFFLVSMFSTVTTNVYPCRKWNQAMNCTFSQFSTLNHQIKILQWIKIIKHIIFSTVYCYSTIIEFFVTKQWIIINESLTKL